MDLNEINNLYIEDYINQTGRTTRKNIKCINADYHKNGDKNPSMGYMSNVKKYHCFTCNTNADLLDLIKYDYGITDNVEAINKIKELYNITSDPLERTKTGKLDDLKQYKTHTPLLDKKPLEDEINANNNYDFTNAIEKARTQPYYSNQLAPNHFINDRGLTEEILEKYKLTFTLNFNDIMEDYKELQNKNKKPNEYKGVYILPFTDEDNKIIYYMGEPIKRGQEINNIKIHKYIKPSGLQAPLFNERYIKTNKDIVFITEGIYDALSIEAVGGQAIALNGVANTRLKKLLEYHKPKTTFILMLDNDEAGQNATNDIIKILDTLNYKNFTYTKLLNIQKYEIFKSCKDTNEMLVKDKLLFMGFIEDLIKQVKEEQMNEAEKDTAYNYLSTFIDRLKQETYKPIATGFNNLDKELDGGITKQSIVIIGGGSSTGKTTYTLQLIDNMIKDNKCLYFSLEMSQDQVISKILSKIAYEKLNTKLEASKILQGYKWSNEEETTIKKIIAEYKERSRNITIINPHNSTIEEIINKANEFKEKTQQSPIIVIDYLQLIQTELKEDTATTIKRATKQLKNYAIDNDTIVFILTAFNRETTKGNNKTTLESGRDTSDIEYSSDYYISLNFTEYENGNNSEDINDLKQKEPRQMTIKLLKNRLGKTGAKIDYNYFSAYNYFEEVKGSKAETTIKRGKAF